MNTPDEYLFRIYIGSHFVKIIPSNLMATAVIEDYVEKFNVKEPVNKKPPKWAKWLFKKEPKITRFYSCTANKKEYRIHINLLKHFILYLKNRGYTKESCHIEHIEIPEGCDMDIAVQPQWSPRDYQKEYIDYLLDDGRIKLIGLQTGKGKTYIALEALARIGKKPLLVMSPKYMEKWHDDILKTLEADHSDIVSLRGSKALVKYINHCLENGPCDDKYVIISSRTLRNMIKEYEETNGLDINNYQYPITPEELCKTLGIGILIIDEAHESFHALYKILTYTNVNKLVALTASMVDDNPAILKMQNIAFPPEVRKANKQYDKYIHVTQVTYRVADIDKIRYMNKLNNTYSHILFEQSIMRNHFYLMDYMDMIYYYVQTGYLSRREDGDRCLVFAATIDMCTELTEYISKKVPDLKVSRYVEDDPYDTIHDSDIIISTILSSGTGFDIKGLITVVQSNIVFSTKSNIQSIGRLRRIPDKETRYYGLYCNNIQQHMSCLYKRNKIFMTRVKVIRQESYPFVIGQSRSNPIKRYNP